MQIKIFTISVFDNDEMLREMNNFLATHKVVEVTQAFSENAYWTFCVRYTLGAADNNGSLTKGNVSSQKKIDYKSVLSDEEFVRFSAMRSIRKKLADDDGIPAFAVFTDAELAGFSKLEELSVSSLTNISGVSKQRAQNYGEKLISMYLGPKQDETI